MGPNSIKPSQYLGAFLFLTALALVVASIVAPYFNFHMRMLAGDFFQWFQLIIFLLAGIGLMHD